MIYPAQIIRYDILYTVNQLAMAMSKLTEAHKGAAKHLLRDFAGSTDFFLIYRFSAFSGAN